MFDINPLVLQTYLADLERRAAADRLPPRRPRPGMRRALALLRALALRPARRPGTAEYVRMTTDALSVEISEMPIISR